MSNTGFAPHRSNVIHLPECPLAPASDFGVDVHGVPILGCVPADLVPGELVADIYALAPLPHQLDLDTRLLENLAHGGLVGELV